MPIDDRDLAQTVIDTVGALVVALDREGRILRWNDACELATGYRREEMLGRPFWELLLPDEREGVRAVFERLLAKDFPNQYENHWVAKSGERRLVSWSNSALLDAEGAVRVIVATGHDITDRTRAEDALRRQAARLRFLRIRHAARRPARLRPARSPQVFPTTARPRHTSSYRAAGRSLPADTS